MDTVSSSDYLAVKKRAELCDLYETPASGNYTQNKQYLTLQTTASIDEFGEKKSPDRFSKRLPFFDLAEVKPIYKHGYQFVPMYVVPRIQIEPYVKNKYVKPFAWNCPLHACDVCQLCNLCSFCEDHVCNACEQTRFHYKTGMFFMNRDWSIDRFIVTVKNKINTSF